MLFTRSMKRKVSPIQHCRLINLLFQVYQLLIMQKLFMQLDLLQIFSGIYRFRSVDDHIIEVPIEKCTEYKKYLALVSIDNQQAFVRIDHIIMFKAVAVIRIDYQWDAVRHQEFLKSKSILHLYLMYLLKRKNLINIKLASWV